jgi:hypothetical protein
MEIRDFQYPWFNCDKQRLVGFLLLQIAIFVVISLAFYSGVVPDVIIAAGLSVWTVVAAAIYRFFVDVPILEIRFDSGNPDLYKPTYHTDKAHLCGFLRVEVINNGRTSAQDCEAKIRFPQGGRPVNENGRICESPSKEFETWIGITWAGTSNYSLTIPPKGNAVANLLVLPLTDMNQIFWANPVFFRRIDDSWGGFIAWVATFPMAKKDFADFSGRDQDGLCDADYGIVLGIFPKNSGPITKEYRLRVHQDWSLTDLER